MKTIFKGTVSKAGDGHNEDSYGVSINKSLAVVCDGATESFDSRSWSRFLVKHFMRSPAFGRHCGGSLRNWINRAVQAYNQSLDLSSLSWSQEIAFNRGSYSTLIAIKEMRNGFLLISGVGDSIVAVLDESRVQKTWPYDKAELFEKSPVLISTLANKNNVLPSDDQMIKEICVSNLRAPVVLCMTDALGQWFLNQNEPDIKRLLAIRSSSGLEALVRRERKKGRMRVDDTTLIHISLGQH